MSDLESLPASPTPPMSGSVHVSLFSTTPDVAAMARVLTRLTQMMTENPTETSWHLLSTEGVGNARLIPQPNPTEGTK